MGELLTEKELEGSTPLLTAEELEGSSVARPEKYPRPRSMSADDQALGLTTSPQRKIRMFEPGWPGITQDPVGPEAKRLHDIAYKEAAKNMFANFGGQVAGSAVVPVVGEAFGPAISRIAGRAAAPATSTGINALSTFARAPVVKPFAERVTDFLGETVKHSLPARAIQVLAPSAARLPGAVATGAGRAAIAAAPAAATGGGAVALDALRARAAADPRAARALALASIMKIPDFTTAPAPVTPATPPVVAEPAPAPLPVSPEKAAEALKAERDRKLAERIADEIGDPTE